MDPIWSPIASAPLPISSPEHAKSRHFDAILEIEKHRGLGVPQVFKTILRWRWHPPPDIETLLELEWKSFACEAYGPRKVTPPLGTIFGGEREGKQVELRGPIQT